ncbi:MAG: pyridoxal phosphate-dependent aminotransferase [Bernardetiaceae bacterium]|jgi:alanine-synthesizing transaminase|nr:pyridoxal phosphate-dependent aminotransferase [Bernardetiaceae bacterium]
MLYQKSGRLDQVFYEIRGPVYQQAAELERQGFKVTKLNIGNPAPFGFDVPDEMIHDMIVNLRNAQGYAESKGLFAARKAVMHDAQLKAIKGVTIEDIFIGNGVSELILMSLQALLNDGDEVLVPAPDYPLWTAAVNLSGGRAVHYVCDEQADWYPDLADIARKITPRTKAIVVINPNNPTGAVYSSDLLHGLVDLAVKNRLIVFSDEIYDRILYDDTAHQSTAAFSDETLFITLGGLSKNYRATGFRAGWIIASGDKKNAADYLNGLNTLASMRLCSNVPAQFAIQTALGGYQSINELVLPSGRLRKQRDYCWQRLNNIPGISCVKPRGALYLFPKIDVKKFKIHDDQQFVLDFLTQQRVLLVQGSGFNWPQPDHFRIVFLPAVEELAGALDRLEVFLEHYQQG